jgi:hypothetical protein
MRRMTPVLRPFYYSNTISAFISDSINEIVGTLTRNTTFAVEQTQQDAWSNQIEYLKSVLDGHDGRIYFEYSIPRMGRRIDNVVLIGDVIFVLEFKVGESEFSPHNVEQVWDYALDLKNFHETSQASVIAPILVCTEAACPEWLIVQTVHNDGLLFPIKSNIDTLRETIDAVLQSASQSKLNIEGWEAGRYSPTPTIIEAAMALYNEHSVAEISRSDASAKNLRDTSSTVSQLIERAKTNREKIICFVTGVPGAGKTLVGLDVATKHLDKSSGSTSVFLSGNQPLVSVLREALTRDRVRRLKEKGERVKKGDVMRNVSVFIQNVHHYRDAYLVDKTAPVDHVAIFDEAQRAWNLQQTADFMKRKKNQPNFDRSEPEFLISCLDRHEDWAVIVCLVGGGQEIHTGEAGIGEWIDSINRSFPDWKICISKQLKDAEYAAGNALGRIKRRENFIEDDRLHLSVSMRSFRSEKVSSLVKEILDLEVERAKATLRDVIRRYPIVLTRDLAAGKDWIKRHARGSERYGLVVSSQAMRLKPLAIDVRPDVNPVHWFLNPREDVRSSYYLEDAATEFQVQGLELDWACVTWDADFRFNRNGWSTHSFVGDRWNRINKDERKEYLKNAYRVLLTRARQGMIIVVPEGSDEDATRKHEFYDPTFDYLADVGFEVI